MRSAKCQCGAVRITCEGAPIRISVCHCLACKQRSGSAFAVQARWPSLAVTLKGDTREFVRIADSGTKVFQYFCPACGTGTHYQNEGARDVVAIPVGLFTDKDFPPPRFSVFESRKCDWVDILGDEIEHRHD